MNPGFSDRADLSIASRRPGSLLFAALSITLFFTSISLHPSLAQAESDLYAIGAPNLFRHNIGEIDLMTTNLGVFGNPGFIDGYGAEWHGAEYLYAGALWIGAIASDGNPHVSTGAYEYELRPSLDAVDTVYPSYEGCPNGNRIGFSEHPDDDNDGLIDEDFQNGKDDDGDGLIDEDFGAISEQMFSCEYWDYTEEAQHSYPNHHPLNVSVRERSFAWSAPELNGLVGFEYEIKNVGSEPLHDMFAGLFVDGDVGPRDHSGYYTDDGGAFASLDTTLVDPTLPGCNELPVRLRMGYMYDIPDGGSAQGGDAPGFVGIVMLAHTVDPTGRRAPRQVDVSTCRFFGGTAGYPAGDPRNDAERYDLMQSHAIQGPPTGDPGDYRFYIGTDRFPVLLPGESIVLTVGIVIGEGHFDTDTWTPHPEQDVSGQPSDSSLLAAALRARLAFEGRWKDLDGLADTGVDGRETCMATGPNDPFEWENPCLPGNSRTFMGSVCEDPPTWVDNDCSPCTPNPYDEGCAGGGCETLVHWYIAPVLPAQPAGIEPGANLSSRILSASNPTRSPVRLRFDLKAPAEGEVRVFDAAGRQIRNLGPHRWSSGPHEVSWDGRNERGTRVPSGPYFLRLEGAHVKGQGRIVLLQ